MEINPRVHLATLYSIAVAIIPAFWFLHGYYAHAEDVQRDKAQIMLEIQAINIQSQMMVNDIRTVRYKDISEKHQLSESEVMEYDLLKQQRLMLMEQEHDLGTMRKELR